MKNILLTIGLILISIGTQSQPGNYSNTVLGDDLGNLFIRPSQGQGANGGEWLNKTDLDINLYKNKHKQYHSIDFKKASLNDVNNLGRLRYNMYQDEMEFMKSEKIYYLIKKIGTEVRFVDLNELYGVFELNKKPNYFKIIEDGKISLLVKESVRVVKGRYAKTSYDKDKLSKFERNKDEYFISFNAVNAIEIPKKKKRFYKLFKDKSAEVKNYMKKNKLSHKDIKELPKIISYFNSL